MNGKRTKSNTGMARRLLALAFALAMLLQSGAVTQIARAIESDPTTGTISLFRWDKKTDLLDYIKTSPGRRYLLLTWTDNGQRYYFRTKKGTSESNSAKYKNVGPYTNNCVYALSDNLVSTQPVLTEALDGGFDMFFTTEIDASLSFRYRDRNSFRMSFGVTIENNTDGMYGISLEYDNYTWGLCSPKYDEGGITEWTSENGGLVGGVRFHGITNAKEKGSKGLNNLTVPVYLYHSGNQIGSGVVGSGTDYISAASTYFETPYVATEYSGISAITHDFEVQNNMVTSLNNVGTYLSPNCTLTVKNGGVLSIGGAFLNDGRIVVEKGGLLILKEGATIVPYTKDNVNGGGVTSRGSVIVRKDAKLIGGGTNGICITGGGVVNFGVIASENFRVQNAYTIENRAGGAVYAGKSLNRRLTYNCLAASLDRQSPIANSTVGEGELTTFLSGGETLLAENAVINKGGTFRDYGSFGTSASVSQTDPIVKIYYHVSPYDEDGSQVLVAHKSELGFYLSEPTFCTRREYYEVTGWLAYHRDQYEAELGRAATDEEFETYFAALKTGQSTVLEKNAGYFTWNGETVVTIPWFNWFSVYENGTKVIDGAHPTSAKAAELEQLGFAVTEKPANQSLFDGATLTGKTVELQPLCAAGRCAEVVGGSLDDGANVSLIDNADDQLNRKWRMERGDVFWRADGIDYYYYLVNVNSDLVMTLSGENVTQTAKKALKNARDQLWRVEDAGDGTYRLIPRSSDDVALAVEGGADKDGANIQVELREDSAAQKWRVIETEETPFVGGIFELEPVCAPGMRLEVVNGTTYYGYNVLLGDRKNVAYQQWRFDKAAIVHEGGETHYYYYICPIHWRHVLGANNSSPVSGTNVVQSQAGAVKARMWRLAPNGDGTYGIVNRANQGLMLNVSGNGKAAGTNVNLATIDRSAGQKWKLIPVE